MVAADIGEIVIVDLVCIVNERPVFESTCRHHQRWEVDYNMTT